DADFHARLIIPQKLPGQLARALGHSQLLVRKVELIVYEVCLSDDVDDPIAQRPFGDEHIVPRDADLREICRGTEIAKERLCQRETAGGHVVVFKMIEDAE